MKVALVHDYIKEYGGAERVLEALHEVWPDAPVYTSVYHPKFLGPHQERFRNWDIRTSWLQKIPFNHKLISPLRLLAPFAFQAFDFSGFDVVIVSATGAYTSNLLKRNTKHGTRNTYTHVSYCHTPPRYLYGYATAREWKKNVLFRVLGELANHILRMVDFNASQRVDYFIANSNEVASRIKKFYRRDAVVVYPPVDLQVVGDRLSVIDKKKDIYHNLQTKTYFLAGGRLARPKHIDLIVAACRELDVSLKVFGRGFGGYEVELKNQKSKIKATDQNAKIEFVGEVTDEEKFDLMRNAKAYIFASEDEDFGITPVEAMSMGIPVIAYRSGGVQESVVEGKTGLFFDELTAGSIIKAIKSIKTMSILPSDCAKQAEKFSKAHFKKRIQMFIASNIYEKNRSTNR